MADNVYVNLNDRELIEKAVELVSDPNIMYQPVPVKQVIMLLALRVQALNIEMQNDLFSDEI